MYLTGKGNFRFDIATSYPYKGNRTASQKPIYLDYSRGYIQDKYNAEVSCGEEADDLIAIKATEIGPDAVVASVDKDMLQIPCTHFNFGKNKEVTMSEWGGLVFFYTQILTGDRADNIIGLHMVGPVKAAKIIDGATTELELYRRCVEAYGDDEDRVIENARLLWLRRYVGQIWEPPK